MLILVHLCLNSCSSLCHLCVCVLLGQRRWDRPVAAAQAPFIASSVFTGARPGYYFSTGKQGLGYYSDDPRRIVEV